MRPASAHSRDQGVEIGAGELPLEWMSDAFEVALEVRQSLGDRLQAREVVRGQHFALHDREVDLDLVEPARVDRTVDRNQSIIGWAFIRRWTDAWPRCDEPLSITQNTRRAVSYGAWLMT